jgi:predicted transcriptional regulator
MKRDDQKHRIFSFLAFHDEMAPITVRQMYIAEHGDIAVEQVRKLMCEMADDGTIQRVNKGYYRRST